MERDKDCTTVGHLGRANTAYHSQTALLLLYTVFSKILKEKKKADTLIVFPGFRT